MPAGPALLAALTQQAARLFTRELERQLSPLGLAPAQLPVLAALADGTSLTQTALARHAGVEQPSMAATLNRMERDGLVIRQPDPADRRSALVALTPLARGKADAVARVISALDTLALEQLDAAERRQLLALLERVIGVLDAQAAARP